MENVTAHGPEPGARRFRQLPGPVARRVVGRIGLPRVMADLFAAGGAFLALMGIQPAAAVFLLTAMIIVSVRGITRWRRSTAAQVGPLANSVLARTLLTLGLAAGFAGTAGKVAAAAAAIAILVTGRTGWVIMAIPAGQWLMMMIIATDVATRIRRRRRAERGITAAITDYAPTFLLHWYAPI